MNKLTKIAILLTFAIVIGALAIRAVLEKRQYGIPISVSITEVDLQNGATDETGIPFWIWVALPRICSADDLIPDIGGYSALGLEWDPGEQMPKGLLKIEGKLIDRVVVDSSLVGQIDLTRYQDFVKKAVVAECFSEEEIMREITYNVPLSRKQKRLYVKHLIPAMKKCR